MKRMPPILVTMLALCSCCVLRQPERVVYRDSIVTHIKEHLVHDTVTFQLPPIAETTTTPDTASHLENAYAVSDAVWSGEYLKHSLKTKPQPIPVPVAVPATDTIATTTHTETVEVPVPAELTGWQCFRLNAFWYLVAALAIALIWILKPILGLWKR